MAGALEGLTIVELSQGMAGALAGALAAENGALVAKVEPPWGDRNRGGLSFHAFNRGKRSLVLDLSEEAGRGTFAELCAGSDGLITDLRLATRRRLGVDRDGLGPAAERLVYTEISGFGPGGPLAEWPGHEWIVAAKSGLMARHGGYRDGPIFTPTPVASFGAAQLALQGVLAGVRARDITGEGRLVQTSLLHALVANYMDSGPGRRRHNPSAVGVSGVLSLGFMTARCADGRYLQMCSRLPHLFRNWMRTIGMSDVADDPELRNAPDIFPSPERLAEVVDRATAAMGERSSDEWLELFLANDVGADPFLDAAEFLESEQALATGRVQRIRDASLGDTLQVGPLANFSVTPAIFDAGAPLLGADTESALARVRSRSQPPGSAARAGRPRRTLSAPLEGVTIVEAAFFYAGPYSMTLLSQLGARVIKVEPPAGDPTRRNWTGDYAKTTVGKESVVVDLKQPEGVEIVRKLVRRADLFIHNFRPGVPEKLGIGFEELAELNPALVYLYASCYGTGGPWSARAGFHSTPGAITGSGILEAGAGNQPIDRAFGDPVGALAVATAALVGLAARDRTGRGQYVETTMLASLAYAMAPWSLTFTGRPAAAALDGGQHGFSALCRLYETAAGWLLLCCLTEQEVARLAEVEGAGFLRDPRFEGVKSRQEHDHELTEQLSALFRGRSALEWEQMLLAAEVPAARADGIDHGQFMLDDPQVRANHMAIEDEMPSMGRFVRGGNSYLFPGMTLKDGSCDLLGGSTAAVLGELGYDEAAIAGLLEAGVTRPVGQGLPST